MKCWGPQKVVCVRGEPDILSTTHVITSAIDLVVGPYVGVAGGSLPVVSSSSSSSSSSDPSADSDVVPGRERVDVFRTRLLPVDGAAEDCLESRNGFSNVFSDTFTYAEDNCMG